MDHLECSMVESCNLEDLRLRGCYDDSRKSEESKEIEPSETNRNRNRNNLMLSPRLGLGVIFYRNANSLITPSDEDNSCKLFFFTKI